MAFIHIDNRSFLTDKELRTLLDAADNAPPSQRFLGNLIPFSGFSATEFCHLRNDWIEWGDENEQVAINIPETMACTDIRCGTNFWNRRKDPDDCRRCKQSELDGRSRSRKQRTVHITETRAIEALTQIFDVYDQMPISGVGEACVKLRNRLDIGEFISYEHLVRTRTRLLAEEELPLKMIAKEMGLPPAEKLGEFLTSHLAPIRAADSNYSTKTHSRMVFNCIKELEPATSREIREHLGSNEEPTYRMLRNLEEYDMIEKSRIEDRIGRPYLYRTTGEEFILRCEHCERVFDNLQGYSRHQQVHD